MENDQRYNLNLLKISGKKNGKQKKSLKPE